MENHTNSIESLVERTRSYVETRFDLIKLKAIDKSSSFISVLITYLVVFVIIGCFFILLNIGFALLIGKLIGEAYYGFFILAAFYAVTGIILMKGSGSRTMLEQKTIPNKKTHIQCKRRSANHYNDIKCINK